MATAAAQIENFCEKVSIEPIHIENPRRGLSSWESRRLPGDWRILACSIWPRLAPSGAHNGQSGVQVADFGEPGPPSLARSGLNWLNLAAPGAIAGSIWPRMARSACSWHPCWVDLPASCGPGRPTGSIWLPNECPIDTISQKKSICLSTIMFRCCLLRAL